MAIDSSLNNPSALLRQWLATAMQWLASAPGHTWRNLVTFAGIMLLAWVAARLLWLVLAPAPAWSQFGELDMAAEKGNVSGEPAPAAGGAGVAGLKLFGDSSAAAAQQWLDELPDAVETALPISLIGIMHASDRSRARAIIHYGNNQQEQHKIGDRLNTGVNVTLESILTDRVIIRNQGRYESVFLYDDELAQRIRQRHDQQRLDESPPAAKLRDPGPPPASPASPAAANARVLDRRNDRRAIAAARQLRDTMLNEPAKLGQLAKVSPASQNGQAVGYRIDSSANTDQLTALGLQPGDIVTHVNGEPVTNPSQALAIYQQLRNATEGSVVVLRGGSPMTIKLRLQ